MARRGPEYRKWVAGEYPYDFATCGECSAAHGYGLCHKPEHAEMVAEAEKLKLNSIITRGIRRTDRAKFAAFRKQFVTRGIRRTDRAKFAAFRKQFARFYAKA